MSQSASARSLHPLDSSSTPPLLSLLRLPRCIPLEPLSALEGVLTSPDSRTQRDPSDSDRSWASSLGVAKSMLFPRGRDTGLQLSLRKASHGAGYRYRAISGQIRIGADTLLSSSPDCTSRSSSKAASGACARLTEHDQKLMRAAGCRSRNGTGFTTRPQAERSSGSGSTDGPTCPLFALRTR